MIRPPGTWALPSVLSATVGESKVEPIGLVQLLSEQTWKRTRPLSFGSGSLKVAVRVGVAVFSRLASVGFTSVGVLGAMLAVLLATARPVVVAARLPAGFAVSRICGSAPGAV